MINFIRVVIPNARQCFIKSENRIHLCSTLKMLNKTAPKVRSETIKESQEFDIFEISRVHIQPFLSIKPIILNDIRTLNKPLNEPFINDRLIEVMEQENLLSSDYIRPLAITGSCEVLAKSRGHTLTDEELYDTYRFGWIFKMFETFGLMHDDAIDDHPIRFNKPTWWYKNNKNPVGLHDSWMLISFYRIMMHKYFKDKFYYYDIRKIMNETVMSLIWGTHSSVEAETRDFLKTVTTEAYHYILGVKAAYNFYLPVVFGLHTNGLYDEEEDQIIYKISSIAGAKIQLWDDLLDYESDLIGGRCSWLPVLALLKANESQKKILLDNYCKKDEKSITTIKQIYEELDTEALVYEQEKKFQLAVETELQTIKNQEVRNILINLAGNIGKYH